MPSWLPLERNLLLLKLDSSESLLDWDAESLELLLLLNLLEDLLKDCTLIASSFFCFLLLCAGCGVCLGLVLFFYEIMNGLNGACSLKIIKGFWGSIVLLLS